MSKQPHIQFGADQSAKFAILPGDPKRVDRIGNFLSDVQHIAYNREMKSLSGFYKGVKILVVSTGMGGASTGITVEELYNIGVTHMIRVGSSGAMQPDMEKGEIVVVNGAIRDEGTSKAYVKDIYPAIANTDFLISLVKKARELNLQHRVGLTRSNDSFYTDYEEQIFEYWHTKGVLASDMETAALFTIGALRGVKTASILNTVALCNDNSADGIDDYVNMVGSSAEGEKNAILLALEAIVDINNTL